ncbi:hypothetical protein niasHT_034513 [Heterodera trifolii]|uniref:Integrase catalytic domain-containing protein n=1 Tax=Heterodera trifolii TaxID=157864 RepID=A0ABD2J5V5_9BILA
MTWLTPCPNQSTSEDQLLSLRVAISRLGVARKENVEQLEDDDDHDHDHETPKPSTTQRTYTLHRQAKRRYRRLPTLAPGLHTEWQADLAIFDRLAKNKTVLTDQGKEFTARAVQHFFRTNDVEHFCMLTSPQFHAGMAEKPENVVRRQPRYRVGDRVRIEKYKHVFQKGYLPRFTNELFTVSEVHTERSPVVYRLRDDHNEIISGTVEQQFVQVEWQTGNTARRWAREEYIKRKTKKKRGVRDEELLLQALLTDTGTLVELNSVDHGLLAREKRAETSNIALRTPADDDDSYQQKLDEYFSKLSDKNLTVLDELGMTKLNAEIKNLTEEEGALLESTKEMGTEAWIQAYREIRLVCQFNYNVNRNRFVLNTDPRYVKKVKVSPQLAYILGFNNTEFMQSEIEAQFMPDMSGGVSSFHVYTPDLIEPMMIGDVTAPVLRIVTIRGNPDQVVEEQFFAIQYHKLLSKEVSEILIEIRTNSGSLMPFQYGTSDQIPAGAIVKFPHCMVVNLDPSTSHGSHWVGIYCASPLHLEYYDSLGLPTQVRVEVMLFFFLYCRCVGMTFEKIVSFLHLESSNRTRS